MEECSIRCKKFFKCISNSRNETHTYYCHIKFNNHLVIDCYDELNINKFEKRNIYISEKIFEDLLDYY